VEVIESPSGRTMPSWVSFTPEGKLVGAAAKSQVASNPNNTVYDVKRIIGRSFTDPITAEEAKAFPFSVVEGSAHGEPQIVVDWRGEKKELRPEEVSAMVLAGKFILLILTYLHRYAFHMSHNTYICFNVSYFINRVKASSRTSSWSDSQECCHYCSSTF